MLEQLDMTIPLSVLGLSNVTVEGIYLRNGCELVIKVASTEEDTHCRKCGAICDKHGHDREMELRHLPILGYQTYIQYLSLLKLLHSVRISIIISRHEYFIITF